jgi:hypothetical protein
MSTSNSISAVYACDEPVRAASLEAEKELAAFYSAVLALHGPEQAMRAANDWLSQVELSKDSTPWRHISIKASDKLAARLLKEHPALPRQQSVRLLRERIDQMLHALCPCTAK